MPNRTPCGEFDLPPEDYFAHKYYSEVSANRARLEAKEYTDQQVHSAKEISKASIASIKESLANEIENTKAHFVNVNNFNERLRDLTLQMARKEELVSVAARIKDKIEVEGLQRETLSTKVEKIITERNTVLSGGNWLLWLAMAVMSLVVSYNFYVK